MIVADPFKVIAFFVACVVAMVNVICQRENFGFWWNIIKEQTDNLLSMKFK